MAELAQVAGAKGRVTAQRLVPHTDLCVVKRPIRRNRAETCRIRVAQSGKELNSFHQSCQAIVAMTNITSTVEDGIVKVRFSGALTHGRYRHRGGDRGAIACEAEPFRLARDRQLGFFDSERGQCGACAPRLNRWSVWRFSRPV